MKKHNTNIGADMLFLLRQQRYLYHQLKILTDKQHRTTATSSPESLLEFISGRRKLVEKLRELNGKLRPIKANWQKLSGQIEPEYKTQADEMVNQTKKIISRILAVSPSGTAQNLPLPQDWKFDELFADTQGGLASAPSQGRVRPLVTQKAGPAKARAGSREMEPLK